MAHGGSTGGNGCRCLRRRWGWRFFSAACLVAVTLPVRAAAPLSHRPHPHPAEESSVPVAGYPLYLENLQIGSPLSDYGSHVGVKASVQDEGSGADRIPAGSFLNAAHYLAFTRGAGQTEQSYLSLELAGPVGGGDPSNRRAHATAFEGRTIRFEPGGWREEGKQGSIRATGFVLTVARNCFAEIATLINEGADPVTFRPVLRVKQDGDGVYEGLSSYIHPQITYTVRPGPRPGETDLVRGFRGNWALLGPKIPDVTRRVSSNFGLAPVADPSPFRMVLAGVPITLAPGAERVLKIVFSESDDARETASALDAGWEAVTAAPAEIARNLAETWEDFFRSVEPIHSSSERDTRLARLAATALRMGVYGPRGAMTVRCSVPSKAHFNFFWAWDTPFQALAHREWDPGLAMEDLTTLVQGQRDDGLIPQQILDDMRPYETPGAPGNSQPPVQGWAAAQVARRTPDPAWMDAVAESLGRELGWWRANRDRNRNGLFEYANGNETGWDETPRYGCPTISNLCILPAEPIEAVDLNPWLFSFLEGLAEIDTRLGRLEEARSWQTEANALARLVEERMWDEQTGLYEDLKDIGGGVLEPVRVKTPASFFPLFVGLTRDVRRARRVIEEHILNPAEFFGDPDSKGGPRGPIPTVAYDDPHYDRIEDGFYWQGQVWLMPAYAALTALYRYGYENEAAVLKERLLTMVYRADPGGIHETYDAITGEVGWGGRGVGEPSVFQFGWSTAFVLEMLLDRHQFDRYLMPGETQIQGYLGRVRRIESGAMWLEVEGPAGDVPLSSLEAVDGRDLGSSRSIRLTLFDPWGNVSEGRTTLRFRGHGSEEVLDVQVTGEPQTFELAATESGGSGGCAVGGGAVVGAGLPCLAGLAALLALRRARPGRHRAHR